MAVSYPDTIGEHIDIAERFATGGLQYVGYFEPAKIAPEQVANLYLFLQNNLSVPIVATFKINVPQTGRFMGGGKALLEVADPQFEVKLSTAEAGLLTLPVTTTEHIEGGEQTLTIEVKVAAEGRGERVRSPERTSLLENSLIDSPVGLNLVSSLGATYVEKSAKKTRFKLEVAGKPNPPERAPNLKYGYEKIWTEKDARFINQAIQELNLRQVTLKKELNPEALYANLYAESVQRFADVGLPLRIGEAITLAKILTYSCQYFLSSPKLRNGLLVPMWEQAFEAEVDTTDSLEVIRTIGYHHLLRLSVAVSFGLIAQVFKRQFWSLPERQAVGNYIADNIETGEPLDPEFLYLPLLIAGTQISSKIKQKGENVGHSLALMKKAREARTDLFADEDLAQADKVFNHILKKALQQ